MKVLNKLILGALSVTMALSLVSTVAFADTLRDVLDRGVVRIGVKADYKPWGFRDTSGKLVGMELDLAQDVADRLGVKLEPVVVVGSNRMQFLQQGKIDIIIATMSDTAKRRKIIGIVRPSYYSSGTNIMANKKYGISKWEDLRGKKVCGIQGAFYNKAVSKRYGAKISAFKGTAEVYNAMLQDRCVAFVYDDSSIGKQLADPKWKDYEMPLPTEDDNPWGAAVPVEEVNTAFGNFLSGVIYDWHETGKLVEVEAKWGIKSTSFLTNMHEKLGDWQAK